MPPAPEGASWCMLKRSCLHLRVSSAPSFLLATDTCKEKLVSGGVFILLQMMSLVHVQNCFNFFKLTVMTTDFLPVVSKDMRAVINFIKGCVFPLFFSSSFSSPLFSLVSLPFFQIYSCKKTWPRLGNVRCNKEACHVSHLRG